MRVCPATAVPDDCAGLSSATYFSPAIQPCRRPFNRIDDTPFQFHEKGRSQGGFGAVQPTIRPKAAALGLLQHISTFRFGLRCLFRYDAGQKRLVLLLKISKRGSLIGLMLELFLEELKAGLVLLNELRPRLYADDDIAALLDDAVDAVPQAELANLPMSSDNTQNVHRMPLAVRNRESSATEIA